MIPNLSHLPELGSIRTSRLRLDRPRSTDVDAIWQLHSNVEANLHNPSGPMTDPAQPAVRLDEWIANWEQHGIGYWMVREQAGMGVESGRGQAAHDSEQAATAPIGITGIRWAIWQGRDVLNVYYRFLPEVWARGYATEATRAVIDVWRAHLPGYLVMAYTIPANTGSQRTALAAGLERRVDLDADDQFGPTVVFALER